MLRAKSNLGNVQFHRQSMGCESSVVCNQRHCHYTYPRPEKKKRYEIVHFCIVVFPFQWGVFNEFFVCFLNLVAFLGF